MMDIWTTALLVCLIFLFGFFTGGYACERWSAKARKEDVQAAQSEHVALASDIERVIVAAESRLWPRHGDDDQEVML
jgi:hypothetical protein